MSVTGKPVAAETAKDMDARYASGDFGRAGGNIQSLLFALHAISRLNELPFFCALGKWSTDDAQVTRMYRFVVHDYGCGEGDGTAAIATLWPGCDVQGYDHSVAAVERANARLPALHFDYSDVNSPVGECDIAF